MVHAELWERDVFPIEVEDIGCEFDESPFALECETVATSVEQVVRLTFDVDFGRD